MNTDFCHCTNGFGHTRGTKGCVHSPQAAPADGPSEPVAAQETPSVVPEAPEAQRTSEGAARDCGHDLETFERLTVALVRVRAIRDELLEQATNMVTAAVVAALLDAAIGDTPGPSGMDPAEYTAMERLAGDVAALTADLDRVTRERDAMTEVARSNKRHVAELTEAYERVEAELDQAESVVMATRQMAIDASATLRDLLLKALGREDDGRTPLADYVTDLTADLATVTAERDRLAETIQQVRELHRPGDFPDCRACGDPWPCPTATALGDVDAGQLPDVGEPGSNAGDSQADDAPRLKLLDTTGGWQRDPHATGLIRKDPDAETGELRWHYGPTDTDPDPGKRWHYDCGGEIYGFKEGDICAKCGAQDEPADGGHG